jgi:hypothetical protein
MESNLTGCAVLPWLESHVGVLCAIRSRREMTCKGIGSKPCTFPTCGQNSWKIDFQLGDEMDMCQFSKVLMKMRLFCFGCSEYSSGD